MVLRAEPRQLVIENVPSSPLRIGKYGLCFIERTHDLPLYVIDSLYPCAHLHYYGIVSLYPGALLLNEPISSFLSDEY